MGAKIIIVMNELSKGTYLKDGKYRIESVLGQGAFGITYLATAKLTVSENLGSMNVSVKVAVKEFFMHDINQRNEGETAITGTESATAVRYREKFRKEAQNLSRMNHPNIVKVLDVFDENNTTYYVMEHIEGRNLDEFILQQSGIKETEALAKIKDVALALSYMHEHKMLHLDIKPKNIMMDSNQKLYLIDFGLSKQYDDKGEPESSTTIGFGTPGYAPIEQANYTQDGTFPATLDIYALGATLYKMVTAETPPKASDVFEEGLNISLLKEKDISDSLVEAIVKTMSPKKKDRPQSVNEFLTLLDIAKEKGIESSRDVVKDADLLKYPDDSIYISMMPNSYFDLSFVFELCHDTSCHVTIESNSQVEVEEEWGNGLPEDVMEYMKENGFFDKKHWENESSTLPDHYFLTYTVVCEFRYKDGTSFVRKTDNADKTYNNKLLNAVEKLIWNTSLRKWMIEAGQQPPLMEDDDNVLDVVKAEEKIMILPDTDLIKFDYFCATKPSPYHRSYEVKITINSIALKLYSAGNLLFDGNFPFHGYKFYSLIGLITSMNIHMINIEDNGCVGCERLILELQKNGESYMKVEACGNEHVTYAGTTNANLFLIKNEIESLIPNFRSIYAQEEAFDISDIKKETVIADGISFNMVYVEGGSFMMGNDSEIANNDERPVHKVCINSYYIGEMQVTQSLWETVMGNNPSKIKLPNGPVESVSWHDCNRFIGKLNRITGRGFRLPTEAEWEYAARGGNRGHNFIFSGSNRPEIVGWYLGDWGGIHEVGRKNPNELGLYDMSGNVCEWCESKYVSYKKGVKSLLANVIEKKRIMRGGSWREFADTCRVTARYCTQPDDKGDYIGLRLVMSV